jgi:MoxR-like ATPase
VTKKYVRFGASPRGAQSLVLAAKVRAIMDGRFNVSIADLKSVALPALRHRTILNFEGEADGVTNDHVLSQILSSVKEGK